MFIPQEKYNKIKIDGKINRFAYPYYGENRKEPSPKV